MKALYISLLFLSTLLVTGCFEEENPAAEENSFLRIYDNNTYSQAFDPLDVKQTSDGGFLILARKLNNTSGYSDPYLLKTDKTGKIISEINEVGTDTGHPVGPLLFVGGAYYFFCLNKTDTRVVLVKVLPDGTVESTQAISNNSGEGDATRYLPLAGGVDGNNLLLLSYDNFSQSTVADVVNTNGVVTESQAYSIGEGDDYIEDVIISQFNQQNRQYPYAIGRVPGSSLYFNGFIDYTFTLAFVNLNTDAPARTIRGTQADGGFTCFYPHSANQFSSAIFNFNQLFYAPISSLAEQNIDDIIPQTTTFQMAEIAATSHVSFTSSNVDNASYYLFASTSKSNQVIIHAYQSNGTLAGSKYLGFSNPYQAKSIINTNDGGLAIVGTTQVAGRFQRICLFKLSSQEVKDIVL